MYRFTSCLGRNIPIGEILSPPQYTLLRSSTTLIMLLGSTLLAAAIYVLSDNIQGVLAPDVSTLASLHAARTILEQY